MFRKRSSKTQQSKNEESTQRQRIPTSIAACERHVRDTLGDSSDIVIKTLETAKDKALLVYIDGMVNQDLVHRDIITPLKSSKFDGNLALALDTVFTVSNDMHAALNKILSGGIGLFYGTSKKVFLIEMRDWQHRQIEEPTSESVIRGPKEGFVENIRTNTAMVRRKIKTPDLRLDDFSVGRQTRTTVTLVYIQGIVNIEVLEELKKRISDIDTDMILETGQIEQLICKNNYSPVSGIGLTQKPDKLAQKILEGRVAVLVDGTPHALIVPELFTESLHSTSDYYNRTLYVNAIRILRSIGLLITILLPGISIAVFTYNQEMLPSVFLTTIISLTLKTPMPFAVEVLVMTVMFELVKEAGTRLPKAVGSAVTIVGSLIIGDEAVRAGLVSAPSIIVVAVTAIASFMLPSLDEFSLTYRLLFWVLGTTMGIIGIGAGLFIMMTQLISVESFGIPILSAFSKNEMKDSLLRFPLKELIYRPVTIAKRNVKRKD